MSSIQDLEDLMERHAKRVFKGVPVTEALVEKAEQFLGVRFPPDYREFLRRWGWLGVGPLDVLGITSADFENAGAHDAVWFTADARRRIGLPHHLVVIGDSDGDVYYCLDTRGVVGSPVVVWDNIGEEVWGINADSLWDFIIDKTAYILDGE